MLCVLCGLVLILVVVFVIYIKTAIVTGSSKTNMLSATSVLASSSLSTWLKQVMVLFCVTFHFALVFLLWC